MFWRASAITAGLVMAAPAHAADKATIDCIVQHMTAANRGAVTQSAGKLTVADEAIPPSAKAAVHAAALECARAHRWSSTARDAAESYALTTLGQPAIFAAIRATGNDPERWASAFRGLPEQTRVGVVLTKDEPTTRYLDALTAAGATLKLGTSGRLAGVLAGMIQLHDESAARFAAN